MWPQQLLDELANALASVNLDSQLIVVDHANVGDLGVWLCEHFPNILTLYANQQITRDEERTNFRAPRDEWHIQRMMALNAQRCRSTSLDPRVFIERFGGRRFDFVVSRHQFHTMEDGEQWADSWLTVTTGLVLFVVDGELQGIPGTCAIPARTPPVYSETIVDFGIVLDVDRLPKYRKAD